MDLLLISFPASVNDKTPESMFFLTESGITSLKGVISFSFKEFLDHWNENPDEWDNLFLQVLDQNICHEVFVEQVKDGLVEDGATSWDQCKVLAAILQETLSHKMKPLIGELNIQFEDDITTITRTTPLDLPYVDLDDIKNYHLPTRGIQLKVLKTNSDESFEFYEDENEVARWGIISEGSAMWLRSNLSSEFTPSIPRLDQHSLQDRTFPRRHLVPAEDPTEDNVTGWTDLDSENVLLVPSESISPSFASVFEFLSKRAEEVG